MLAEQLDGEVHLSGQMPTLSVAISASNVALGHGAFFLISRKMYLGCRYRLSQIAPRLRRRHSEKIFMVRPRLLTWGCRPPSAYSCCPVADRAHALAAPIRHQSGPPPTRQRRTSSSRRWC